MKKLTTNEIRNIWLDFWKVKGHYEMESKSLVPYNDDSLLFINSGVATLKNYLSGKENPPANKIVNSQKSLRTNDIENVGVTSRHHTMFEMLGNFSIGDYFKEEVITWAWELLTSPNYFSLDPNNLYITVHPQDEEAYKTWLSLGINEKKIIKLEGNFWEIGSGPGGPNSEIFFDRGANFDNRNPIELIEKDLETDRVIEIWNIVFSQYNCDPEIDRSEYKELPQKNIDTGMGLERMACILQEVETNFETDNFEIIMNNIEKITATKYSDYKKAYRIITDHIRAIVFAINDSVIPSNEGRGYVIRRILRRAVKYAYIDLNIKEPFLYKLVEYVVLQMKDYYPELSDSKELISEIILKEEEQFLKTVNEGMKQFNIEIKNVDKEIRGEIAFKLYDTYGFPYELTEELALERGLKVNLEEFNEELEKQKNRARNARKGIVSIDMQNTFFKEIDTKSEFIGYESVEATSEVVLITDNEKVLDELKKGENGFILLDKTPFYATSGGQEFDTGNSEQFEVLNVVKLPGGQHLHEVNALEDFKVGITTDVKVDLKRRKSIEKFHTSTHILHYALNKVLGEQVKQAGSLQDDKRTRFDYTFHRAPTKEELKEVSNIINDYIKKSYPVTTNLMSMDEAVKLGAKALFEDKYGDKVRVVQVGDSIELCGGTHIKNTADIEKFLIVTETSIGSGIRRIEALTSNLVDEYKEVKTREFEEKLEKTNDKISKKELVKFDLLDKLYEELESINEITVVDNISSYNKEINKLKDLNVELKKSLQGNKKGKIKAIVSENLNNFIDVDGVPTVETFVENVNIGEVKEVADELINQHKRGVVILKLIEGDKISIIVKVSDDLTPKVHAGKIIQEKLKPYAGRGGGKPNMAQGGGTIK